MLPATYIACVRSYFGIVPGCRTPPIATKGWATPLPPLYASFENNGTTLLCPERNTCLVFVFISQSVTANLSKLSLGSIYMHLHFCLVSGCEVMYCSDIITTLFWWCFVCLHNWHNATVCVYFSNSINTCNLILNIMKVVFHLTTVSATCVVTLSWLIAEPRVVSCVCRMSVRVWCVLWYWNGTNVAVLVKLHQHCVCKAIVIY
jgi:hypothetical protein